ncbi:MAG: type I-G CRISPR-associated protein Csb2, partial [Bryobacteraceae bacterium]
MTALGIRYLTGYSVAANLAMPRAPEWPPHPGRIFMALAAAYFETAGDDDEQQALEWLESAGTPAVGAGDGEQRSFVETYVPANDKLEKQSGGLFRARQPRSFAVIRPQRDSVYLIWNSEVPPHLRGGLERLCRKVTRIGHSSSLVQMWVAESVANISAEWQPADGDAQQRMRVPEPGTLAYLKRAFNSSEIQAYSQLVNALEGARGREKIRLGKQLGEHFPDGRPESLRPKLTHWQGYA